MICNGLVSERFPRGVAVVKTRTRDNKMSLRKFYINLRQYGGVERTLDVRMSQLLYTYFRLELRTYETSVPG